MAKLTSSHWGAGLVEVRDGRITDVRAHPGDPEPSAINGNIAGSLNGRARVLRPAVRKGWLENGPGAAPRGEEPFVEVSWDRTLDLLASEVARVPPTQRFAGSYGWSSAGRFHHAQSQLKRLLNTQGGFVRSEGNYSYQAALVLMPHIVMNYRSQVVEATRWPVIAKHTRLMVMFGGMAARNMQVGDGGIAEHRMAGHLADCQAAGVRFVNISPLRRDLEGAEWLAPRPGTDVAVMMGLAYVLLEEGLEDRGFLARHTVGFGRLEAYLRGEVDGTPKSADWAASISGLPAERLRALAREMAGQRCMVACAAGLQRADYGEQPMWMCVALAAMLGQVGLPGGGYTVGYGVNGTIGAMERAVHAAAFPQGINPVSDFIPVAMIAEMLLNPGGTYAYDGQSRVFPDARLVWWAGGNPFHHHQDLNRLRRAFARPETVIVNEINWTATARHADIVLPVAAPQERSDFGAGGADNALVPMPACAAPPGEARSEFAVFAALAERMGDGDAFCRGRDEDGWLRHLWQQTQNAAARQDIALPEWSDFLAGEIITLPDPAPDRVFLARFRADPVAHPLPTPSGRIEIFSEVIAGFDLPDCPGHPMWFAPRDDAVAGLYPLALVSGQPATRLHSQLDNGATSLGAKVAGREPVLIHPDDAAVRGIAEGDVVELFNARGRCLAGARITEDIRTGCVFLWTGAWYDPDLRDPHHLDRHGNPNVLTHDMRTSALSQGPAAHSARVELRKVQGPPPAVMAHEPPEGATVEGDHID